MHLASILTPYFPIAERAFSRLGVPRPAARADQRSSSALRSGPLRVAGRAPLAFAVDLEAPVAARVVVICILGAAFCGLMMGLALAAAARVTL